MQPAAHGGDKQGGGLGGSTSMSQKGAVADLIAKPAERVAAHERFFHTYFSRRKEADEKLTKKTKPGAAKRAAEAAEKQSSAAGDDDEEDDEKDDGLGAEGEAFAERLAQSLMRDEGDDDDDDFGEDVDDDDDDFDLDMDDEEEDGEEAEADDEEEEEEEKEEPAPSKRSLKRKKSSGPTFQDASEFADILEAAADQDEGVHRKQAEWEGGKRKSKKRMKR